jgi:cyclophilin family peptidyl-prolyl cis-trans isomerase
MKNQIVNITKSFLGVFIVLVLTLPTATAVESPEKPKIPDMTLLDKPKEKAPEKKPEVKEVKTEKPKADTKKVDLSVDESTGLSKSTVVIKMDKGVVKYKFYSKDAPKTVARMVELIGKGFYNGLKFHRVVPGFVAQGGDPSGNGSGGTGQKIKNEANKRKHVEGVVAMARTQDLDTADCQFYITLAEALFLDNPASPYTVFGKVTEGMDVVKKIQIGDKMNSVTIE